MTIADKDRLAGAEDDDELLIELEDGPEFAPPEEDEQIEDAQPRGLEAETVPEDEEGAVVEPQERQGRSSGDDDGGDYSEAYERATQAEEALKQERANAVWNNANNEARLVDQQRNNLTVGRDALQLRLDVAYQTLENAREAGDQRLAGQVERDLAEMNKLKGDLDNAMRQLPDPNAIINQGRQQAQQIMSQAPQGKKVGSGIQARHPLAERWASANPWMRNNLGANRHVIAQSQAMTNEGFDPNSPGFYAELSRRMKLAYPNLKVATLQAQRRGAAGAQRRGAIAPVRTASASAGGQRTTGRRYTLTVGEQARMKAFNLDPHNKVHQKAWAKARMESASRMREVR